MEKSKICTDIILDVDLIRNLSNEQSCLVLVNSLKFFIKGESEIVNFQTLHFLQLSYHRAHTDTYLTETQRLIEIKLGEK